MLKNVLFWFIAENVSITSGGVGLVFEQDNSTVLLTCVLPFFRFFAYTSNSTGTNAFSDGGRGGAVNILVDLGIACKVRLQGSRQSLMSPVKIFVHCSQVCVEIAELELDHIVTVNNASATIKNTAAGSTATITCLPSLFLITGDASMTVNCEAFVNSDVTVSNCTGWNFIVH